MEAPKSGAAASLCAILRRVAALSSFLRSLLTAPFGKKIRQQFLAFKSQNAARHHRTMIDAGNVKKPKGTLESAAPAVACAVDNTAAPCLGNGARTHWTRFQRDVKRRVGEPMIGEGGSGSTQRNDFGMRRRISAAKRLVAAAGDHLAVRNHDGANRNFSGHPGRLCFFQRHPHERAVSLSINGRFGRTIHFAVFSLKRLPHTRASKLENLLRRLKLIGQTVRRNARERLETRAPSGGSTVLRVFGRFEEPLLQS